jgi:hypothetical protein
VRDPLPIAIFDSRSKIEMYAASGLALDVNTSLHVAVGAACDVALTCVDEK